MNEAILAIDHKEKFDFIGDIHGCYRELIRLLGQLGYTIDPITYNIVSAPKDRILVFLGDLTDRGEDSISVLRIVMQGVQSKQAVCLRGNHDNKLYKALIGKKSIIQKDSQKTLKAICEEGEDFKAEVMKFLESLPYQIVIQGGKVIAAHAGLKENYHNIDSKSMKAFALYGGPTGENDEEWHPIRENWESEYHGEAVIIYGHTPVSDVKWVNNTINIDTGCFKTGILTAFKWPEKAIVQTVD